MKATNSLTKSKQDKMTFSAAITTDAMQKMILKAMPNAKAAARLTSTLISAVSTSEDLQECKAETIVAAALRGEGMGLIYGHGYYIVPYKPTAQFVLGYKGYIQLAISTGFYADIDCVEIRQGELRGRDPRTGRRTIDLATYETDEERLEQPIIGYYAYYELKDGTFRYEYWPLEKLLQHADRYAPAFKMEKFRALQAGELEPKEVEKLLKGSPWYDEGAGQERMCKKTVLRRLLTSGYAPLSNEVQAIFKGDQYEEVFPEGSPALPIVTSQVLEAGQEEAEPTVEGRDTGEDVPQPAEGAGDPVANFFDA